MWPPTPSSGRFGIHGSELCHCGILPFSLGFSVQEWSTSVECENGEKSLK